MKKLYTENKLKKLLPNKIPEVRAMKNMGGNFSNKKFFRVCKADRINWERSSRGWSAWEKGQLKTALV